MLRSIRTEAPSLGVIRRYVRAWVTRGELLCVTSNLYLTRSMCELRAHPNTLTSREYPPRASPSATVATTTIMSLSPGTRRLGSSPDGIISSASIWSIERADARRRCLRRTLTIGGAPRLIYALPHSHHCIAAPACVRIPCRGDSLPVRSCEASAILNSQGARRCAAAGSR
jgi:hypothetical protein